MTSSEGNQLLAGAFHAIMDEIDADILQIAKESNWKWIITHEAHQPWMPVMHQSTCTFKAGPWSLGKI